MRESTVNISGNDGGSVTEGLPENAFAETRSLLKKAAMAEPGPTAERHGYHNMLEQTEVLGKPAETDEWPHRRHHLTASLQAEQKRLVEIRQGRANG